MSRSLKKGPFINLKLEKKILDMNESAKKTVVKQVLKYAPLKADISRALASDETIKTKLSPEMVDLSDETVWEAEAKLTDRSDMDSN